IFRLSNWFSLIVPYLLFSRPADVTSTPAMGISRLSRIIPILLIPVFPVLMLLAEDLKLEFCKAIASLLLHSRKSGYTECISLLFLYGRHSIWLHKQLRVRQKAIVIVILCWPLPPSS